MFEVLLWAAFAVVALGLVCALDGSRDVFHPLVFIAPMLGFLYWWMPLRLLAEDGLSGFFTEGQLIHVQLINVLGVACFVVACCLAGLRVRRLPSNKPLRLGVAARARLRVGAVVTGGIGLVCWLITIINVGGFVNAFKRSYSGGWDDSGYVRDGSLLLVLGVLLLIALIAMEGPRFLNVIFVALFALPWLASALLMARRGPTFAFVVTALMGFYMFRRKRPPVTVMAGTGLLLGWLVLFLVSNRSNIYLGSDFNVSAADVTRIIDKADTGNEYVYGSGSLLSAEARGHYFWMRRYLAQLLVRPIPRAVWPTKYEDFGVPELLVNGGTGEGFADALGWIGASGSAPGIIADLWVEVWWLCLAGAAALGWTYGYVWRKAVTTASPQWASQFVVLSALSIYLVMQTMEAVIFRTLLLSIPCWVVWNWALRAETVPAQEWRHEAPLLIRAVKAPAVL